MTTQKPAGKNVRKNPDDAEIEEIMSEIEVLQKEMRSPEPAKAPSRLQVVANAPVEDANGGILSADEEEDILKEFRSGGSGDGGLEDNLVDLKGEDTGKGILDEAVAGESEESVEYEDEVEAVADSDQGEEMNYEDENENGQNENADNGTLSMTLTGNMTLKLKYATEGQEVAIGFGDGCLTVKLADGTEFKVPVRKSPVQNKNNQNRLRKAG